MDSSLSHLFHDYPVGSSILLGQGRERVSGSRELAIKGCVLVRGYSYFWRQTFVLGTHLKSSYHVGNQMHQQYLQFWNAKVRSAPERYTPVADFKS